MLKRFAVLLATLACSGFLAVVVTTGSAEAYVNYANPLTHIYSDDGCRVAVGDDNSSYDVGGITVDRCSAGSDISTQVFLQYWNSAKQKWTEIASSNVLTNAYVADNYTNGVCYYGYQFRTVAYWDIDGTGWHYGFSYVNGSPYYPPCSR